MHSTPCLTNGLDQQLLCTYRTVRVRMLHVWAEKLSACVVMHHTCSLIA